MIKKLISMSIPLLICAFSALANGEDFTKGVMLSSVDVESSGLSTAQLTELSSAAIEKGLKDTQLLAKPSFDSKTRIMTLNWHSISKMINGTEKSKALSEPLTTQLKLPEDVTAISVGQQITLKGDLDSLLEDFDLLLRSGEESTEINSEENIDASTTNGESDSLGSDSGGSSSSGGGYLSEGGLSENTDLDDLEMSVDKIVSTTEQCALYVDWSNLTAFQQERVIKTSTETGEIVETGACQNIGQANKLEKDFSQSCDIQINGTDTYAAGYVYYTYVNGERVDLSGCRYDKEDFKPLIVKNDFDSCSLALADVNIAEKRYYPAAVKFAIINGTRYNLTECEVIPSMALVLPSKIESCNVMHVIDEMTSYKMTRVEYYDPTESEVLAKDECLPSTSFAILKDYEAGCTIKFQDDSYIKGFKYYANIDNERHEISACEYDESELTKANVLKDFDSCSLKYADVNEGAGYYNPAFIKYTLIDGQRYDMTGCETSVEVEELLPVRVEVCELEHSIPELKTYRMERQDIYDPSNSELLIQGDCYSIEEIAIQRDFDAGCSIQLNSTFNTYTRGYKYFSTVDNKKYVLSECEYNAEDALTYENFKDYSICDLGLAVVDILQGKYQRPFATYTIIDGQRYEVSACETSVDDMVALPTKIETCEMFHDYDALISHDMERVDTYDPQGESVLKSDDCYSIKEYQMVRDFEYEECINLPNYTEKNIALGYKHYYIDGTKNRYVGDCEFDLENRYDLFQGVDTCSASENLTSLTATINKKWYYVDDKGETIYITKCQASEETYPIVDTANTCSPQYIASTGEVVLQKRKGWIDGNGEWHYSTNCEPTEESTSVLKEWCSSPAYEHDFVGGQSYKRSRNYYMYEGQKVYINGCTRDSTDSYPHVVTNSGCGVTNNDTERYTQYKYRRYVVIDGSTISLESCTNETQKIYYVPIQTRTLFTEYKSTQTAGCSRSFSTNLSEMYSKYHNKSYGNPTYSPSATHMNKNQCAHQTSDGPVYYTYYYSNMKVTDTLYQRGDGSTVGLNRKVLVY